MGKTFVRKRKTEYSPNYSVVTKKALRSLKRDKAFKNILAQAEILGNEIAKRHSK